jgi:hypothetical protein
LWNLNYGLVVVAELRLVMDMVVVAVDLWREHFPSILVLYSKLLWVLAVLRVLEEKRVAVVVIVEYFSHQSLMQTLC